MLLVVSHPGVASGIETLLRLERRYAVRRAAKLGEAVQVARSWPADAVLVDATILPRGTGVSFGTPTLVLAGGESEGTTAGSVLDDPRGWVAKDAASADLVAAVERLLTGRGDAVAGAQALVGIGALLVIFVGLLLYLVWIALV